MNDETIDGFKTFDFEKSDVSPNGEIDSNLLIAERKLVQMESECRRKDSEIVEINKKVEKLKKSNLKLTEEDLNNTKKLAKSIEESDKKVV